MVVKLACLSGPKSWLDGALAPARQLVEIGEAEQSTAPGPPGWGLSMGPIIPGPPHRNWSWL